MTAAIALLLGLSAQTGETWRYTTKDPGKGWERPDFKPSPGDWKTGRGGFGNEGTPWRTPDIWMRREFVLAKKEDANGLELKVCHDEDFEVYFNGVLAAQAKGHITDYKIYPIRAEARRALKTGANLIAVHCHQTTGGQFIDVGFARPYAKKPTWQETLLALRARGATADPNIAKALLGDFPVRTDWLMQDTSWDLSRYFDRDRDARLERDLVEKVLAECGAEAPRLRDERDRLAGVGPGDRRWLDLYVRACLVRRANRLKPLLEKTRQVIFARHQNMGGGFFAYTEYTSWRGNVHGGLFRLDLDPEALPDGKFGAVTALLRTDTGGIVRDPELSYDAKRLLFAWRKDHKDRFYKIFELELATGETRLITGANTYGASYDPCYLPDGNILFVSSRVVQAVDCAGPDVSNFFICDGDGRHARRIGFDQVHTLWPAVLDDGRVVYMRWDYNDRSQIYTQPLFQMNPDGTAQTEYYGNASFEPTTYFHPQGIPGTSRVVCAIGGHHNPQCGKLAVIDPRRGRQGVTGVIELPSGKPPAYKRADRYAQEGDQYCYPFPLDTESLLVSYDPIGYHGLVRRQSNKDGMRFHLYYMTFDGRRELLAADGRISSMNPLPVLPRKVPHVRPSRVDYRKPTGTYYLQDVYEGPGLRGVPRGTIKKLRVVALRFREMNIGRNSTSGKGGSAGVVTPIATGTGAWDVKVILGDATVHEDGSAFFEVPAKTPVYFQALDEKNRAVQTMRSWSTLMPGERFSCTGCHEDKGSAPPTGRPAQAMQAPPERLKPFYGPPRGFSFPKEIQPILDRHCVECHRAGGEAEQSPLTADPVEDKTSKRFWSRSYLTLTSTPVTGKTCNRARGRSGEIVNWISNSSEPTLLPPRSGGSTRSGLIRMLEEGHPKDAPKVRLSRKELDKLCAWIDLVVPFCGDYLEAHAWNAHELKKARERILLNRKMRELDRRNVRTYLDEKE